MPETLGEAVMMKTQSIFRVLVCVLLRDSLCYAWYCIADWTFGVSQEQIPQEQRHPLEQWEPVLLVFSA